MEGAAGLAAVESAIGPHGPEPANDVRHRCAADCGAGGPGCLGRGRLGLRSWQLEARGSPAGIGPHELHKLLDGLLSRLGCRRLFIPGGGKRAWSLILRGERINKLLGEHGSG